MSAAIWGIVPAAGSARRMGGETPKQYLPLAGRTVIEWSLAPLLAHPCIAGVVVVLAADDVRWQHLPVARHPKIHLAVGGGERVDSVLAGARVTRQFAGENDWLLVHDAARPCLHADSLDQLIQTLDDDTVGGLLAAPVVDTLKRADSDGRVAATVSREHLWRALTPQMFRCGVLWEALQHAVAHGGATDEAQAVEALGHAPKLVPGDADNIKITLPADLARAERLLVGR